MSVHLQHRRFTVRDYYRMAEAGILREDDRVELIAGEIVQMSPIGRRHAACVKRLARLLHARVGRRAIVGVQDPIRLGPRAEPQPDLTLLRPRADFYEQGHPHPDDVLLVIEVSELSMTYDRDVKAPMYARAGIAETWIVDVEGRHVLQMRSPARMGYRELRTLGLGQVLSPRSPRGVRIPVAEVLGRRSR